MEAPEIPYFSRDDLTYTRDHFFITKAKGFACDSKGALILSSNTRITNKLPPVVFERWELIKADASRNVSRIYSMPWTFNKDAESFSFSKPTLSYTNEQTASVTNGSAFGYDIDIDNGSETYITPSLIPLEGANPRLLKISLSKLRSTLAEVYNTAGTLYTPNEYEAPQVMETSACTSCELYPYPSGREIELTEVNFYSSYACYAYSNITGEPYISGGGSYKFDALVFFNSYYLRTYSDTIRHFAFHGRTGAPTAIALRVEGLYRSKATYGNKIDQNIMLTLYVVDEDVSNSAFMFYKKEGQVDNRKPRLSELKEVATFKVKNFATGDGDDKTVLIEEELTLYPNRVYVLHLRKTEEPVLTPAAYGDDDRTVNNYFPVYATYNNPYEIGYGYSVSEEAHLTIKLSQIAKPNLA